MRRVRRDKGFALLIALALVLIAGVVLAGVARRSAAEAIEATESVERLQRLWAVRSCRETLSGRVEALLDRAERGPVGSNRADTYANPPTPRLHVKCRLAETDYELVLTDEQAKLNVNTLLADASRGEAESVVRRMLGDRLHGRRSVELRLQALPVGGGSDDPSALMPRVGGYGQIFADASPGRLVGARDADGLIGSITCWGSGKVNIRRASDAVIRRACERELGAGVVGALLDVRRQDPYRGLDGLLAELDRVDEETRKRADRLLTDRSTCHGLWVIARGPRRSWYTMTVVEEALTAGSGDAQARRVTRRFDYEW